MAADRQVDDALPARTGKLTDKYRELAAKYAALVGRRNELWGYRLALQGAVRGLSTVNIGLAVARKGNIVFRNVAFLELERSSRWSPVQDLRGASLPLGAWALRVMDEMPAAVRVGVLRLRNRDNTRVIALRAERQKGALGFVVWVEDVTATELRETELAQVRQSIIHQHRLLMLGEAAASVAHDLGSTLRALAFRTASLRHDDELVAKHGETMQALEEGLSIAAATVQRLHDFVRSGGPTLQPVDVGAVLRSAVALFDLELEATQSKVHVRLRVPELPLLRGSSADLSHLFLNLLRNASDAMPEGGEISITGKVTQSRVILVVEDEGSGLSASVMQRLFEPFFSTKGLQGTGLGLWLAAGTMRRLGGTIEASSRKRRGTRFVLTFPRDPTRPLAPAPSSGDGAIRPPASAPPRAGPRSAQPSEGFPADARAFPSASPAPPARRGRAARPTARPRSGRAAGRGRSRR